MTTFIIFSVFQSAINFNMANFVIFSTFSPVIFLSILLFLHQKQSESSFVILNLRQTPTCWRRHGLDYGQWFHLLLFNPNWNYLVNQPQNLVPKANRRGLWLTQFSILLKTHTIHIWHTYKQINTLTNTYEWLVAQ